MGIFDWLFGIRKLPAAKIPAFGDTVAVEKNKDFGETFDIGSGFTMHSRDVYGPSSTSPNGQYMIICKDSSGNTGGHRNSGKGKFFLLDGKKVVFTGRLERPNGGKIANNGNATVEDWGFGSDLKGTFIAVDINGKQLIKRDFKANILNNGISPDGRFAACQTANSPGSPDNSILAIFDLTQRKEIGAFSAESGWGDDYEFPGDDTIVLIHRNLGKFRYKISGEFIDRALWQQTILDKAEVRALYLIKDMLKEEDKNISPARASMFIDHLDNILKNLLPTDTTFRASTFRQKGEVLESQNQLTEALSCYDQALSFDPKVGIKRHADALRKKLSAQGKQK